MTKYRLAFLGMWLASAGASAGPAPLDVIDVNTKLILVNNQVNQVLASTGSDFAKCFRMGELTLRVENLMQSAGRLFFTAAPELKAKLEPLNGLKKEGDTLEALCQTPSSLNGADERATSIRNTATQVQQSIQKEVKEAFDALFPTA